MKNKIDQKKIFGLIGKNISYSFSKKYFLEKFQKEFIKNIDYQIFDLQEISLVKNLFKNPYLKGLNITIPYKEKIIPYLDNLSNEAFDIKAINTLKIDKGKIIGYNTDAKGFEISFKKHLKPYHKKALVLGTGGASKAICFVLKKLFIDYLLISRKKKSNAISYEEITPEILNSYLIIINTTPLGTYPNVNDFPSLPYQFLTHRHYLYDLTYHPLESLFLTKGKQKNAHTKNGLEMLYKQAECSWQIWTNQAVDF